MFSWIRESQNCFDEEKRQFITPEYPSVDFNLLCTLLLNALRQSELFTTSNQGELKIENLLIFKDRMQEISNPRKQKQWKGGNASVFLWRELLFGKMFLIFANIFKILPEEYLLHLLASYNKDFSPPKSEFYLFYGSYFERIIGFAEVLSVTSCHTAAIDTCTSRYVVCHLDVETRVRAMLSFPTHWLTTLIICSVELIRGCFSSNVSARFGNIVGFKWTFRVLLSSDHLKKISPQDSSVAMQLDCWVLDQLF